MAKKEITICLTGFISNGQDGSASVQLINNDVYDQIDFDRIDQRFEDDVFDIELTINEKGEITGGLDIVTKEDVKEFKECEYYDYDEDKD